MLLILLACSKPVTVTLTATCTNDERLEDVTATATLTGPEAVVTGEGAQAALTAALKDGCLPESAPLEAAVIATLGAEVTATIETTAEATAELREALEILRYINYH